MAAGLSQGRFQTAAGRSSLPAYRDDLILPGNKGNRIAPMKADGDGKGDRPDSLAGHRPGQVLGKRSKRRLWINKRRGYPFNLL
ncbi:MAG TPA: hypothetical protein VHX61_08055 [Rhizomicrobium sp.]|jgi:hypothetical protein|nr:hypothetical protein [Rhizomicrobium sp.]